MNSKVTIIKLAYLIAQKINKKPEECENVIRSLFQEIGSALQRGENVKVKGLGTFKISKVEARKSVDVNSGEDNEIPAHNRISFIPAKEMAAAVNAPFEMFETVSLEEKVTEEELSQAEAQGNFLEVSTLEQEMILQEEKADEIKKEYPVVEELQEEEISQEMPELAEEVASEKDTAKEEKPEDKSKDEKEVPEDEIADEDDDSDDYENPKPKSFLKKILIILGILMIIVGGVFIYRYFYADSDILNLRCSRESSVAPVDNPASQTDPALIADSNATEEESVKNLESEPDEISSEINEPGEEAASSLANEVKNDPVPTQASDAPVYDVVSDTRYLSTIAKEHYGNFNLWPYIYMENEKILGHPNRIRPGTRVVVPPLSKYKVDPKNKADIEKSKKLGIDIYKRFDK